MSLYNRSFKNGSGFACMQETKDIYLCKNPTGNKYCDYTVTDKPRQCNYEKRCDASYLDCQYFKKQ